MAKLRGGQITLAEAAVIRDKAALNTAAEIALGLNRSEAIVSRWIKDNLPRSALKVVEAISDKKTIKRELQRSLKWQYLREELTEGEVAYFEEQYALYMQQFREDVLPSEEDQIFNLIKLDISVHRNRRDVRLLREEIDALQSEFRLMPAVEFRSAEDVIRIREIEQALGINRQAEFGRNKEYLLMSSEVKSLQNDLKATRHQRINKVDGMKESFIDVLKNLQDEEYRSVVGTGAEFAKRASEREAERLANWHTYEDGVLDQPLLTSDTALDEPDDNS